MNFTPGDLNKLIGILGRLGSDHDGERSAAGLLASRLVRDRGLQWADLIQPPALSPPQPKPTRSTATDLALAGRHACHLTVWETDFVVALSQWRGRLSPSQLRKLATIAHRLRSRGCA